PVINKLSRPADRLNGPEPAQNLIEAATGISGCGLACGSAEAKAAVARALASGADQMKANDVSRPGLGIAVRPRNADNRHPRSRSQRNAHWQAPRSIALRLHETPSLAEYG